MAFNISDITFSQEDSMGGPLNALVTSEYETNSLRYPLDLGANDKAHALIFYIRTVTKTSGVSTSPATNVGGVASNMSAAIKSGYNSSKAKVNSLLNGSNDSGSSNSGESQETSDLIANSIQSVSGGSSESLNGTSRTNESIAIYMPNTLEFTFSQTYTQLAPGNELLGQLLMAGSTAVDAYKANKDKGTLEAVKAALASTGEQGKALAGTAGINTVGSLSGSSDTARLIAAKTFGIRNPMLEMIYSSPNFRSFTFEFLFYPRSEGEALEVQKILQKFRYHQAPEIKSENVGFLDPPSFFDIEAVYNGTINPNIPLFKTCILTGMSENYTRDGWSAYEVEGQSDPTLGGTGHSVGIQLILNFQEIYIQTKADFPQY